MILDPNRKSVTIYAKLYNFMNKMEAYGRTVRPEVEAETKFSRLPRLVALDIALSEISPDDQPDTIGTIHFAKSHVQEAIFKTWEALDLINKPLATKAWDMMILSREYQNGETDTVEIGYSLTKAKEEAIAFLRHIRRNNWNRPHGLPDEKTGYTLNAIFS